MTDLRVVGRMTPRVDAVEKVTGATIFGMDLRLEGMLTGKVLRSPYPHARILSIDTSAAKKIPGVEAVITAEDVPNNSAYAPDIKDAQLLATDRVRFIGDEVALVAAINEDIARKALKAIKVEYEPLPCITDPEEAIKPGAILIHEDHPDNIAMVFDVTRGDIESAFAQADVVISGRYVFPTLHQAHMEPNCAVAVQRSGHLTVFCASQVYFELRRRIAQVLGLKENQVTIKAMEVGGCFGARNEQKTPILAALLAMHTHRPVRLANTREEEFLATRPAMAMTIEVSLAADRQGRFLGKRTKIWADNGAYTSYGVAVLSIAAFRSDNLYRYGSVSVQAYCIYTNKAPVSAYRGFGNPQMHFAVESLIDELAVKLDMDPGDLRLKNFIRTGDTGIHGFRIASCGLAECLEEAKRRSGWDDKRKSLGYGRGIGMAALIHATGSRAGHPEFSGGSAVVRVSSDGQVTVYVGESEIGQGAKTVFAQIAAEELGVDPGEIKVILGDTDLTPLATGTHGSKLTTVLGKAVMHAARDAKLQIMRHAAEQLGEGDLVVSGGVIRNSKTKKEISWQEAVRCACEKRSGLPIVGLGINEPDCPLPDETGFGNPASSYPFGVQIAEVSVDPHTGKVKVERVTSVHDVGKAINPQMAEGQIHGGVLQGVGMGIMEKLSCDENGVVLNPGYMDYKLPTVWEAPQVEAGLIETIDPNGPYGAKGLGEPPIIAVAPAIANAIYDALGVRIRELPVTPDKLLRSIKQAGAGPLGRMG